MFLNDQEGIIEANIVNLIDYSIFKNIESFAFMSTAEIYSGLNGSVKENSKLITTPSHPRGVYIESKRLSESIISKFQETSKDVFLSGWPWLSLQNY